MSERGRSSRVAVDVVIAVRNEEENIPVIANTIRSLPLPDGTDLRVVFVEDGSSDGTVDQLRKQVQCYGDVKYYSIRNPHGQTAAIAFGLSQSDADAIVMMDADGGHPPSVIPSMIDQFLAGANVVQGVRTAAVRRDSHRNLATALFQRMVRLLTRFDSDRQNVFFRLVSQPVAARILNDNKTLYFLRLTFLHKKDIRVQYVTFVSPERVHGRSKYNLKRLLAFSINGFLSLMSVPRFLLIEAVILVPAAVAAAASHWITAAVLALPALAAAAKYIVLCAKNPLQDISIVEQGCQRRR